MATLRDVRELAMALPETSEKLSRGNLEWRVREKLFVWERPLRKADLAALGDQAPSGTVLGARVADLGEKEALLASDPAVFFTTPHFDGYCAVLLRLEETPAEVLGPVVLEAWLAQAPGRLAKEYLEQAG